MTSYRRPGPLGIEDEQSLPALSSGEASIYSDLMLSRLPKAAVAGRYMVERASTDAMYNHRTVHSSAVQCVADDFVSEIYRSAAELRTESESLKREPGEASVPRLLCTFRLNGQPMSTFTIGSKSYPAFSGLGSDANKRESACLKGAGPIPPGTYYIVDRPTGGMLGPIRDWLRNKGDWLALFADDGSVDDVTLCNQVARGNFRLHPKGPAGRSEGCITIEKLEDFRAIREQLMSSPPESIPNSQLKAYAKVVVE